MESTTPTPLEAVLFRETVQQLFDRVKDRDRDVLVLRIEGYTAREIAEKVNRSERGVQRVLQQAREILSMIERETDQGPD